MHNIPEHNTKQKWEGYNGEHGWIDFLEHWYAIRVDNLLKWHGELVRFNECWLNESMVSFIVCLDMMNLRTINVPCLPHLIYSVPHFLTVLLWTPHQTH